MSCRDWLVIWSSIEFKKNCFIEYSTRYNHRGRWEKRGKQRKKHFINWMKDTRVESTILDRLFHIERWEVVMAESVPYENKVYPLDIDRRRPVVGSSSSWCTAAGVVGEQEDENDSSSRGHSEDSEEESSSSSSSLRVSCELFLSSC